jgi:hypothetical protein
MMGFLFSLGLNLDWFRIWRNFIKYDLNGWCAKNEFKRKASLFNEWIRIFVNLLVLYKIRLIFSSNVMNERPVA